MNQTYCRCLGCKAYTYRESTIKKHVASCKENPEARYVKVTEEVVQVEEKEEVHG